MLGETEGLMLLFWNALSCFRSFLLIIYFYFLIPAVIAQIYNPFAKLIIPIGIPIKEAKAGMETHPVIVEITISKWSN